MKNYSKRLFAGRINRETAIAGNVIFIITFSISAVVIYLDIHNIIPPLPLWRQIVLMIGLLLFIVSCVMGLSVDIRRRHDIGIEPFTYAAHIMVVEPSQETRNKWGLPPKPGIDWKGLFGL